MLHRDMGVVSELSELQSDGGIVGGDYGDVLGTGKTFSSTANIRTTPPTSARLTTPSAKPTFEGLHVASYLFFVQDFGGGLRGH